MVQKYKIFNTLCDLSTFLYPINRKCLVLPRCITILVFDGLRIRVGGNVKKRLDETHYGQR